MSEALVFDLDDTLYLERDYVRSGFRAVARFCAERFGYEMDEVAHELESLFEEEPRLPAFDRWLASKSLSVETHRREMVDVYRAHQPALRPVDGAAETLAELAKAHTLGLLTDGSSRRQRAKLDALGIASLFSEIVVSEDLGPATAKPDRRLFREIADKLETPPNDCVYLADNPEKDFIGARRAGFGSIRVRLPGGLRAHLEPRSIEYAPDLEITDLTVPAIERALGLLRGRRSANEV